MTQKHKGVKHLTLIQRIFHELIHKQISLSLSTADDVDKRIILLKIQRIFYELIHKQIPLSLSTADDMDKRIIY